ncbi:hypothetical protein ACFLWU_00155 [Chloroflexota bacterium]
MKIVVCMQVYMTYRCYISTINSGFYLNAEMMQTMIILKASRDIIVTH